MKTYRRGTLGILLVTLVASGATSSTSHATHFEPRRAKLVSAYLVPSYGACTATDADTCVGPVRHPDDTNNDPLDPAALEADGACRSIPAADCELDVPGIDRKECRRACGNIALNDPECQFLPGGWGFISARASASGVKVKVRIQGIDPGPPGAPKCIGKELLLEASQQLSTHDCSPTCLDCEDPETGMPSRTRCTTDRDCLYGGCTLSPPLLDDYDLIGCTVVEKTVVRDGVARREGWCDIGVSVNRALTARCNCEAPLGLIW